MRILVVLAVWLIPAMACNTPGLGGPTPTPEFTIPPLPMTPTPYEECDEEISYPTLESIDPAAPLAGEAVRVTGSGGFAQCGDFVNESARDFPLHLDDEPIGTFNCYVNHCEATIDLPDSIAPGHHVLSVEGGSTLEFEVGE